MWGRLDDGWWSHPKLQRVGRAGRGLLSDLLSYSCAHRTDGFIATASLGKLDCSLIDRDFKSLLREGALHKRGDVCACMAKRDWEWPRERGHLIHDYLDYHPSREENDVAKAQRAELRDPNLRQAVRTRDFGRCRYCAIVTNPKDRRGETGETLDHVDPAIAAGADNLVLACRACNSAKKKRTPEQALMQLLDVADVRAKHYAELGVPDPDLAHDSEPTQVDQADGLGRDGSGRVGFGSASQVGPATTARGSEHPNPYLRAGHGDPALEPPPPQPDPPPARPTNRTSSRSQRRKRKGRR